VEVLCLVTQNAADENGLLFPYVATQVLSVSQEENDVVCIVHANEAGKAEKFKTMTTASVPIGELPLEQRFERLAEKYRALKQHYEVTRKLLDEKLNEKVPERSSFGSFFSTNTPDPNEVLVLKEELEGKILENERLVMDLSEARRNVEITSREISELRQKNGNFVAEISDLKNALEIRVSSEQRLREQFRDLEVSRDEISDHRSILASELADLRTSVDRKDLEIKTLRQEISDHAVILAVKDQEISESQSAHNNASQEISDLRNSIYELERQLAEKFSAAQTPPVLEISSVEASPNSAQLAAQVDFLGARNRGLLEELNRAAALVARERIAKETAMQNFEASEKSNQRIADELETLRNAYELQMDVLTESLATTRAQLDEIDQLKNACSHCGTVAKCQHAICSDCHAGGFLSRTFFQ
jgi:DNA repair exonuclease SbcCD ATPase subunit